MTIQTYFVLLSIFIVAIPLTSTIYAQGENVTTTEEPKFLAIQHAQYGSISEINATTYSLELSDISDKTILFSDRPDRIVTSVSTNDFIANWSVGEDSFAEDAPNAVLIIDESEKQYDAIVDLFDPVYDPNKKSLKYEISPVNASSIGLPSEFESITLVVDTFIDRDNFGAIITEDK